MLCNPTISFTTSLRIEQQRIYKLSCQIYLILQSAVCRGNFKLQETLPAVNNGGCLSSSFFLYFLYVLSTLNPLCSTKTLPICHMKRNSYASHIDVSSMYEVFLVKVLTVILWHAKNTARTHSKFKGNYDVISI